MKKLTILFSLVALFTVASFTAKAQVSASASTAATIITPIAINKVTDMNFGNVAVSPTLLGTVVLAPSGTRTPTGGVTLPVITGTVAAARFTVTGLAGSTYSITLPGTAINLTSGANTLVVDTFTSTPTPSGTLAGGTQDVYVGATLHVAANQASGLYTNAAGLVVTVNYN